MTIYTINKIHQTWCTDLSRSLYVDAWYSFIYIKPRYSKVLFDSTLIVNHGNGHLQLAEQEWNIFCAKDSDSVSPALPIDQNQSRYGPEMDGRKT